MQRTKGTLFLNVVIFQVASKACHKFFFFFFVGEFSKLATNCFFWNFSFLLQILINFIKIFNFFLKSLFVVTFIVWKKL